MSFLQEIIQDYTLCNNKKTLSRARIFNLTDDDLQQVNDELQDPHNAFGLQPNDTWPLKASIIRPYIELFNPNKYPASPATPKIREAFQLIDAAWRNLLSQHASEINASKINADFLEAVHQNNGEQINQIYKNCTDKLDEQSKIAYFFYAKLIQNDELVSELLTKEFIDILMSSNFAENRLDLIDEAVKYFKEDKYNQKSIRTYIKLLFPPGRRHNIMPVIAAFEPDFDQEKFEKLCLHHLKDTKDYIFVMLEIIKNFKANNLKMVQVLLDIYQKFQFSKLLNNAIDTNFDINNFLTSVLNECVAHLRDYSKQQRAAILSFFARHEGPYFIQLLECFKKFDSQATLEVVQRILRIDKEQIEKKFDLDAQITGHTLLHFLMSLEFSSNKEFFGQVISDYRKYINATNTFEQTPLHIACEVHKNNEDLYIMESLLKQGADPDVFDAQGKSPLIIAVKRADINLIQLLLKKNARPERFNQFRKSAILFIPKCEDNLQKKIRDILIYVPPEKQTLRSKRLAFWGENSWQGTRPKRPLSSQHSMISDILRCVLREDIPGFISIVDKNYKILTDAVIANEILPHIVLLQKTVALSEIFLKFPQLLAANDEHSKNLFYNAIKTQNMEIIKLFLQYGAEKYCQQPDVKQLIASKKTEQLEQLFTKEHAGTKRKQPEEESKAEDAEPEPESGSSSHPYVMV